MPATDHLEHERRRARRVARRRAEVRRRRVGVAAALGALVLGVSAWAAVDRAPDSAARTTEYVVPAAGPSSTVSDVQVRRSTAAARGRLGSGNQVNLAFAGDIHFESPIRERLAASPASVLAPIRHVLSRADITVANLETAVTDRGRPASKAYVFRAPPTAFRALESGGVDVASIANNHGMDFGRTGLRDTLAAGRRSGVSVIGGGWNDSQAYAPYRRTVNGQRIAIIGATQVLDDHLIAEWTAGPGKMGLASAKDEPRLLRAVREARATSDTVVVYLHWGLELASCPTSSQTTLARKLADTGADIVVGSHAHVLLGAGHLGKTLVGYGLGNFVFYANRELTTRSGVLEVTVTGRRIDRYRWIPARISSGSPYPLTGSDRAQAVERWNGLRACTSLQR
jgi:poly-gamma-glutamate synthesis protein (capsule biosynthesis protein)